MGELSQPTALDMDRWVCPNDRQLALRAKLGAGWSVHTHKQVMTKKQNQLTSEEEEQIMNVIMRADMLEQVEQERIGRLVEKLDNMKKNAMGDGSAQCILCGDAFGMLGASPTYCDDCKKAVCAKCGIDTFNSKHQPLWLCKICSENRELWKRSGAWFFKGLPKYSAPSKQRPNKYKSTYLEGGGGSRAPRTNGAGTKGYNTWKRTRDGNTYNESDEPETESGSEDDEVRIGRKHQATTESDGQSLRSESTTYDQSDYPRSASSDYSRTDSRTDSRADPHDYDQQNNGADYRYYDEPKRSSAADRGSYDDRARYDRMDSTMSTRTYRNGQGGRAEYSRQDSAKSAPAMYDRQDSRQPERRERRQPPPAPGSYDDW